MSRSLTVLGLLFLMLAHPAAVQGEPSKETAAERRLEQAHTAFEVGDYDGAIRAFREAYELRRDPRLLYNLALAYYKRALLHDALADLRQAEDLFRRFLLLAQPTEVHPSKRPQLHQVRRLALDYLARITKRKRDLEAGTTEAPAASRPAESAPASQATEPSTAPAIAPRSSVDETSGRAERPSRWHWLLYGVAGVLGAAAATTGGLALHYETRANDAADQGDRRENESLADTSDRLALTTDVLLGSMAAVIAVGVVLHLRARGNRTALRVGPGGARLAVHF